MSSIPPEIATTMAKSLAAQDKIVESTPALDNAFRNSAKQGLPDIAIGPAQGAYLSILCKTLIAKRVLEIGTLGGYSTLWFADSSPEVKVTSIEIDPKHRDVALENIRGAGKEVSERVEIILGAALDVLPQLSAKGEIFDFIFIDAAWEEQREYFDWALKLTRKGGIIYVDNAVRQITESEESDPSALALVEAVSEAVKERKVQASLIPTLNTQKETLSGIADGFLIASVF